MEIINNIQIQVDIKENNNIFIGNLTAQINIGGREVKAIKPFSLKDDIFEFKETAFSSSLFEEDKKYITTKLTDHLKENKDALMPTPKKKQIDKNQSPKDTYYQAETDALFNLVMKSNQSWRKKWASEAYQQQNGKATPYKMGNQLILFDRALDEERQDPRWFTFKQIQYTSGMSLEKGSKASKIAFWSRTKRILKRDEDNKPVLDEKGKKQYEDIYLDPPVFVTYNVFNGEDIKGLEPFKINELPNSEKAKISDEKYQKIDKMINSFCHDNGIKLKSIPSEKAFYNNGISEKIVALPKKEQFESLDAYYSTLFHEVGHSTKVLGIRINKETDDITGNHFGSKNYAKEELTAELTALFMCREYGIDSTPETEENSLAYLKNWTEQGVLNKEDFSVALKEAQRATKAITKYEGIEISKKEEIKPSSINNTMKI